jgi:hypothetical protein
VQALEKGWLARAQRIRDKEARKERELQRMQRLSERRASVDSQRSVGSTGSTGSEDEPGLDFKSQRSRTMKLNPRRGSRLGSVNKLMTRAFSLLPRRMSSMQVEPDDGEQGKQ